MEIKVKSVCKNLRDERGHLHRARLHQGWWRACVLNEDEGQHPSIKDETIYNCIASGVENGKNFLTREVATKAMEIEMAWRKKSTGAMPATRLANNLLSSQPLAFNFFIPLLQNLDNATKILQNWFPKITSVERIDFEYAPTACLTEDNTAFDVAISTKVGQEKGFIGIEVKYTEPFSQKKYDKESYRKLYKESEAFNCDYKELIMPKFNQLFRNQLISEAVRIQEGCKHVSTAVFCHPTDTTCLSLATEFQQKLNTDITNFKVITFQDFIEAWQLIPLAWEARELTMLLWARYLGSPLSAWTQTVTSK